MYILDPLKSIKFHLLLIAEIIYMVQHDRQHHQWLNVWVGEVFLKKEKLIWNDHLLELSYGFISVSCS